jgi:hypothetical protein
MFRDSGLGLRFGVRGSSLGFGVKDLGLDSCTKSSQHMQHQQLQIMSGGTPHP